MTLVSPDRQSIAARFDPEARRITARARERFLSGADPEAARSVGRELANSWARSKGSGVDPDRAFVPTVDAGKVGGSALAEAAEPVMRSLAEQCRDSDAWGMLLDRDGVQVAPTSGDARIVHESMERGGGVGAMFREDKVGTNGAGISLERLEPFIIIGEEHFRASEHMLASVGVPLRDGFGRLAGLLLMCQRIRSANHMIVPYAQSLARGIGHLLVAGAGHDERALFDAFSRHSRRPSLAVVAMSEQLFVANSAAQQLLRDPSENDELRRAVREVAASGTSRLLTVRLGDESFRAHCRVVELSHGRHGAVVSLTRAVAAAGGTGAAIVTPDDFDPVRRARALRIPTLVVGESGAGRAHRASSGTERVVDVDAAGSSVDPVRWLHRLRRSADTSSVLIRHLDAVAPDLLPLVLEVVRASPSWVAATTVSVPDGAGAVFPVSVEVAPLRDRIRELPRIVRDLLAGLGAPDITCTQEVMSVLAVHPWPGNVSQLRRVLAGALVTAVGPLITIDDLPREAAVGGRRQPEGLLARTERELVFEALRSSSWNRDEAAHALGISRATMYRRIRQFGFQIPSSR